MLFKTRHHVDEALVLISAWSTKHQQHQLAVDVRPIHSNMVPSASFSTWSAILVTWILFSCAVVSSPAVSGPLTWSRAPEPSLLPAPCPYVRPPLSDHHAYAHYCGLYLAPCQTYHMCLFISWLWWIAPRNNHELCHCPCWGQALTWYMPVCPSRPCFWLPSFNGSGLHQIATTGLLALLLCGDIQLSPGSKCKSVYTCGYSEHIVDYGTKVICCDNCDMWLHKYCVSMSSITYSELISKDNWFCYRRLSHDCDPFMLTNILLIPVTVFLPSWLHLQTKCLSCHYLNPSGPNCPHGTQPAASAAHTPSHFSLGLPVVMHITHQRMVITREPLCLIPISPLA